MADMYLGNESGGFDLVGTTNIKNIDFEEAKISKEDYENLSEEEQKTGIHLVTGLDDTENGGGSADLISYDNTNSGLDSTNVQGAIDELNSNLGEQRSKLEILASNTVKYDAETDSLLIYLNGNLVSSVSLHLGLGLTTKEYSTTASGGTRTLTLSEDWSEITALELLPGLDSTGYVAINSFVPPRTLNYTLFNQTGVCYGNYTYRLKVTGKLA